MPLSPRDVLLWTARQVRGDLALGALMLSTHQACEAAVPILIGVIVDRAITDADVGAMVLWGAVLAGLFVVLATAGCIGGIAYERAMLRAEHRVRLRIADRALDPRGQKDATRAGEVVSLATVDAQRVAEGTVTVILFTAAATAIIGTAVVLLATSWRLGVTILVGLPLMLLAAGTLARPLQRRSAEQHAAIAATAGVATDLLTGLRVVKGLGAEAVGARRYRVASRHALVGALRAARVQGVYEGVTIGMSGIFLVVVAWLGARMALDGTISVGELVAAVGLTQFLVGPLSRLVWGGGELARGWGSAGRVAALLSARDAVADGTESLPTPVRGALSLRGVRLGSLRGLDLEIGPGEIVGVVAEDPADAQALLACLARTEDPEVGEVLVDGRPLPSLRLQDGRGALLAEPHDPELFEGTLGENVDVAGDGTATRPALEAAAADEVVDALPEGLDAPVGEHGRSLSGGQRQRVALARALQADPPVLVLHEPTTAVDAATEHRIAIGLAARRAGRTTVLVTTSPALLSITSRAIVLRGGVVVADGTHRDLAAADAGYREAVLS
jgi:putative ABC transport system ATP-binding protein